MCCTLLAICTLHLPPAWSLLHAAHILMLSFFPCACLFSMCMLTFPCASLHKKPSSLAELLSMLAGRAQAYVGAFMWQPSEDTEGMSSAESAASESATSESGSASSHTSDSAATSTSSAVPLADADTASDSPSSSSISEASSSSPEGTTSSPSGKGSAESDFGGLTSDQQLCQVGTFAQVHTIVPIDPRRAQLLLLGHRRLKRTKQVCAPYHTLTQAGDPCKLLQDLCSKRTRHLHWL